MKKLITLATVASLALATASPALAKNHKGHNKGEHFKKMDTNGDGVVSKEEHITFTNKRFDEMDSDKNGELSKEEIKSHHKKMKEKFKKWREKRKERKESKDDSQD